MFYAICKHQRRRSVCASHGLISIFAVHCLDMGSVIPLLLPIFQIARLASFWSRAGQFESYLVVNPWRQVFSCMVQKSTYFRSDEKFSEEEKSVVNGHCNHLALKFSVCVKNAKTDFLRCIGYLSFTKDRIKHDLLQTQFLVLQLNFLNY